MKNKGPFKNITELCKKGDFEQTLELVNKHGNLEDHCDNSCGIKLLISCCNACIHNAEYISEEHLQKLLQLIVLSIRNPSETDLLSYIQSIYHILNMLVRKNSVNVIIEMEKILIPSFLPYDLPKKHRDAYNSIVIILHNIVAKCAVDNIKNQNSSLVKISILVSKICGKVLEPLDLIKKSYNCFSNLICLKISVDEQKMYFREILILVDRTKVKPKQEECFKHVLGFSSIILNNILKTFDFKQAREFHDDVFGLIVDNLVHKEYVHLVHLLKSSLVISPVELENKLQEITKSSESMRILNEIWKGSENKQQIRDKLIALFQTVTFYYKSLQHKEWIDFSEIIQVEILNFISNIPNQSFMHLQIILCLIQMYAQSKMKSSMDYHRKCLQLLEMFIKQIRLKKEKSEEWTKAWNMLGIGVFNIGVHLNRNSNDAVLLYYKFLLKSYVSLESRNGDNFLKHPTLVNCLRTVCELYTNKPEKYLEFTALGMLLCSNNREHFMTCWIKLKHGLREDESLGLDEIKKITIVEALKMLQGDEPGLVDILNDSDKLFLLKFELEQYKKKWKSKIATMAVVKELCEISDLDKVVEVIVDIFGDHKLPLHEDCLEYIADILFNYDAKLQQGGTMASKIRLGLLYHIYYKCSVDHIISKNISDMEWTSVVPIKQPTGLIPRDPNEECDIVSSYESLTLVKYLCNLNNLDKAFTIISAGIDEFNASDFEHTTLCSIYNCLTNISFEYRLLRYRIKSLQASQLALKIALIQNNMAGIVQTTGFIIEFADPNKPHLKKQIENVETLLESGDFSKESNSKTIIIYYICKSKALFNIDHLESHKAFKKATDLMCGLEEKEGFGVVKSQLHLLKFKFSSLPCDQPLEMHKENTLMDVYTATSIMFDEYKKNSFENREYDISILLDASEELTKLYHLMKVPMEVRAYGSQTFLLTQKLVLPLRCSAFLMYLAHADLMSDRLQDCQVKIDGMANILSLYKPNKSKNLQSSKNISSPKLTRECNNDSMEMVLNLPIQNEFMKQLSPSSPKLVVQTFRLPSCTKHDSNCNCFYCICYEYQNLVLEQTRLCALLNIKQNNASIAQSFYEGALNMYDFYCNKWASNGEIVAHLMNHDVVPEYQREFLSSYGYILLNFSSHLRRTNNKTEALDMNDKLLAILAPMKREYIFLYNEAIVQKLGYLTEKLKADPLQEIQNDMEFLSVNEREEVHKTPESKRTQITFPVKSVTPYTAPSKPKVMKCLSFNISPDSHTENAGAYSKRQAQQSLVKTPKIQIYTDTSERKSRQRKTQENSSSLAGSSKENVSSVAPLCNKEVKSTLKTRTKLLTEKLKQSSKKNDAPASQTEKRVSARAPSNLKKLPIRKNLLMELGGSDNEPSSALNGAIRKSTRNKK